MNECNQPLFVNPQFDTSGANQSAAICGRALAAGYDALKAVSTAELRLGRRPLAARKRPPECCEQRLHLARQVPAGARRMVQGLRRRRSKPLMDGLDFHPYPIPQSLPFASGYPQVSRRQRLEPSAYLPGLLRRVQRLRAADDRPAGGRRPAALPQRGGDPDRLDREARLRRHRDRGERGRRRARRDRDRGLPGLAGTSRCSSSSRATRT